MTIRLLLLGSPTVEYDGKAFALSFERRHQLLAFLALKKAWVGRAELAAMFWPEQESKLAYTNLRKTLHRLQSLAWAKGIESQGGALRFQIDTDVSAFEAALREGRAADALPMRRGDLLTGFNDDQSEAWTSWLGFERDRLRLAWRDAALSHLADDIEVTDGVELSARLLKADSLDEAALRAHMSWLERAGNSVRARQAYREFVARLEDDLGLTPSAELQSLHDSLGSNARVVSSVVPPAAPKADADFVGRTVELRRIATLMALNDCRLLCLLGPGGVGKTRLARRALSDVASDFEDGSVFVPLEDISSSNELGGRLARELGIGLTGKEPTLDQVIEFLRQRQMLLVFDNFEQLVAEASILNQLLEACPHLKIIVTSRVRLNVANEWLLPLDGLPCPEVEDQDNIELFDAAKLFIQAAQRVAPTLAPSAEAAAIVDICQLVEGLPLAIQLAAAWTRVLSCDAIAAELRQGTELLQATDPAHPLRHASIENVFDQSWRLLGASERDALARLSVFHGGFGADAARGVAAAPLPVLAALADKSLLRKEGARLFMHPLVHHLSALRLPKGAAREAAEHTHALYFQRLMEQLRRSIENGDRESLQRLDIEFENCRAAWRWSIKHRAVAAIAKTAPTLFYFCDHRGRYNEGMALLREPLEPQTGGIDPSLEALLLSEVAHLEYRLDRYADAQGTATRALAAGKTARLHIAQAVALQVLASCHLRLGRLSDAKRTYGLALREALAASDPRKAGVMLHNQAVVARAAGQREEAQRLFSEAMAQHKVVGDTSGEALCLTNLALLLGERGQLDSAVAHLNTALAICDRHGFAHTRALVLSNLSDLSIKRGDRTSAQTQAQQALEAAEAIGNRNMVGWSRIQFLRLALARGDLDSARTELVASLTIAIAIRRPSLLLAGVGCFGEILSAQGETDCARLLFNFAITHPSTNPSDRDELRERMTGLPAAGDSELAWPGLELYDLVNRIVIESEIAQASLIATLRGAFVH